MGRVEASKEYFLKGYNCSQSVVLAFKDLFNIDEETLLKIASPFGGGMGRLRETCGAFSGALIVIGLLYGYNTPEIGEIKKELYEKVQEIGKKFEEKNGSLVCRTLLNLKEMHSAPTPEKRDENFYKRRPCISIIENSVSILDEFIKNHE